MKILKYLFSGAFMGILLLVFAIAIGYATFVENDYGAVTAKLVVYNSTWFEVLLLLMVINFAGMIFTKKLYIKSKLNILIIHLALVIIIIGAGVTRYIGFEGQMHIRNGQTSNIFRSSDTYLQVQLKKGEQAKLIDENILLSSAKSNLFSKAYHWQEESIKLIVENYYPSATQKLVKVDDGDPYLSLVVGGKDGRHQFNLKEGETKVINNFGISFGDTLRTGIIQIIQKNGNLMMRLPQPMRINSNDSENTNQIIEGFNPLTTMSLQTIGGTSFVIKEFLESAQIQYQVDKGESQKGIPVVKININEQRIFLPIGQQQTIKIANTDVTVKVGYKTLALPFYIKLNKFDLERYPSSNSPSSFASDVTLIDKSNDIERPFRIFMNNILSYGGYRFYQSSYDQDEQGTILSVNHDYWGTFITYSGYFLLFGSLIASFFTKHTRFRRVSHQISEIHNKRKAILSSLTILLLLITGTSIAQQTDKTEISSKHAAKFGELLLINKEGRIEPINTAANKILMKVYKKATFNKLTPDQVYLGMITDHDKWMSKHIIKVDNANIQQLIGVNGDYASFVDFMDNNGQYKLRTHVEQAYIKKPALRDTYDKALINVDERVNVYYMALNGALLTIFPIPNDPNSKWVNPSEFHQKMGHGSTYGDYFENYLNQLRDAKQTGNYSKADEALKVISEYQQQNAKSIVPSALKTKLEIMYNNAGLFKKLFPVYLLIGIIMVAFFFWQIFNPEHEFKLITNLLFAIIGLAFLAHTVGLGLRWYISGHAPWSNGYESMIYISWAIILAGFLFMKKSAITLGVSAILAGITLLTAHMSWMNPEITNLVPVLKSYWLTFHVATITASYGFLALGCMLGFLNLSILVFRSKKNLGRINIILNELTLIVEMALIVGLVLLVIGNFLGGIWANESWGRYWGWDPKETWTLVTIIIYSFTLHSTLIPGLKNNFTFNFMAMASFGTVLMTYFGVNYFLSGLHSYANGDPVQIPNVVYYSLGVIFLISVLAAINVNKLNNQSTALK